MSQTPTLDPTTRRFFAHLWRGGSYRYWWALRGEHERTSLWWKQGEQAPALLNSQHNMFFGVHPCTVIPPINSKGQPAGPRSVRSQIDYIAAINCLFAEFDAKDFAGGKAETLGHIEQLHPAPSVIVDSGGGYHCYWLLVDPFIITTDDDRARADRVQKGWVKFVGSDDSAKDLARVLRVPGTQNFKPAYGPDYPIVHFEQVDLERLYSFEELAALAPAQAATPKHTPKTTPAESTETSIATVDQDINFATIAEVAGLFERLSDNRRDSYTTWIDVGMAVRSMEHIGFYLWKKWSETSTKYKPGDCEEKWQTFRPGTPTNGLLTLDSLRRWAREDDPDGTTTSGDMVPREEYDRVKAKLEDLEQRDIWQQQILYRQDLQPTEKGVIIGLGSIVAASRNLAGNAGRVPLAYDHAASVLKISKTTIGRGVEAGERIGIWRRDPEAAQSRKGNFDIQLMRLELQPQYDTPAVLPLVDMPKRGGARPGAGRKPRCSAPDCPPGTVHRKVTSRAVSYYCPIHGLIAEEELPDIVEDYIADDDLINIETGDEVLIASAGEEQVEDLINIETRDEATPNTAGEEQTPETIKVETGDTTISMAPTFVTHAADLQPYVNPDQERYVLEGLKLKGTAWARQHMASVAPWDKWPARVHHAVHRAEGLSQELVEPPSHGMRGTAVRA